MQLPGWFRRTVAGIEVLLGHWVQSWSLDPSWAQVESEATRETRGPDAGVRGHWLPGERGSRVLKQV